ncbi:hypothetical protein [Actinorugispora endophytica]|uniref:Uncharacterized protein n=1 Tax=Actinorugispora endophytica TaxID=1605990 RepID=A0A4R6UXL3_9ACTN|nr:hypothetical protein [Actinorugispora endophytica]TDQ52207.1 hypothetical protein EV190_10737 [Actinorugispora endophytica]
MDVNRADGAVGGPALDPPPSTGAVKGRGRGARRLGPVLLVAAVSVAAAVTLSHPHGTEAAFTVRATTPPLEVVGPSPEASESPSQSPSPSSTPSQGPSTGPTGETGPDGGGSVPDAEATQGQEDDSPGFPDSPGTSEPGGSDGQHDGQDGPGRSGEGDFSPHGHPHASAGSSL